MFTLYRIAFRSVMKTIQIGILSTLGTLSSERVLEQSDVMLLCSTSESGQSSRIR